MKIINWLVLTFLLTFLSVWLFNHFNPWVGIGIFGIYIYLIIKKFTQLIKKFTQLKK